MSAILPHNAPGNNPIGGAFKGSISTYYYKYFFRFVVRSKNSFYYPLKMVLSPTQILRDSVGPFGLGLNELR